LGVKIESPGRALTDAAEEKPAERATERLATELARRDAALAAIGIAAAIICAGGLAVVAKMPMVPGSFESSCMLLFGYPKSPFCRPRISSADTWYLRQWVWPACI